MPLIDVFNKEAPEWIQKKREQSIEWKGESGFDIDQTPPEDCGDLPF